MSISVQSFTIYHSPNAYLGTVLLRRALATVPDAQLVRRPIFVPRERGVLVAEMLGGGKTVTPAPTTARIAGVGPTCTASHSAIPP